MATQEVLNGQIQLLINRQLIESVSPINKVFLQHQLSRLKAQEAEVAPPTPPKKKRKYTEVIK